MKTQHSTLLRSSLVALAGTLAVSGCAKTVAPAATVADSVVSPIEGVWSTGCVSFGVGNGSRSGSITVVGSVYASTGIDYADDDCSTPLYTTNVLGTAEVGEDSAVVEGAKDFDLVYTSSTVTLAAAASSFLSTLNDTSTTPPGVCGHTDWAVDTAIEILGATDDACVDESNGMFRNEAHTNIYQLISIADDGNSFTLGNSGIQGYEGFTAETRPTELGDPNTTGGGLFVYTKVEE